MSIQSIIRLLAGLKVSIAYWTNNNGGKQEDVHGRSYRYVYEKFGRECMRDEYMHENSWLIK